MKKTVAIISDDIVKKLIQEDIKKWMKIEVKVEDIKKTEYDNWEVKF